MPFSLPNHDDFTLPKFGDAKMPITNMLSEGKSRAVFTIGTGVLILVLLEYALREVAEGWSLMEEPKAS